MKIKKVNRYWCDHCNKAGLQSRAMVTHEKHCTMNPARECRVCKLLADGRDYDFEQKTLAELLALLPDATAYNANEGWDHHQKLSDALTACFPEFRKAAGDCPACMMAALRQAKIPVPMAEGFDFKAEMKSIFDGMNEDRHQGGYY